MTLLDSSGEIELLLAVGCVSFLDMTVLSWLAWIVSNGGLSDARLTALFFTQKARLL
jgi:hypothetical protein